MRRILAIVVRSVKTGMMKRGDPRSRLKNGAKLGCRGAAIGPRLGRLHKAYVIFDALGVRNFTQFSCKFRCIRRPKPHRPQR